ncbi:MAG: hypothetical protein AAGA54_05235 [Myxococcota bacterium]
MASSSADTTAASSSTDADPTTTPIETGTSGGPGSSEDTGDSAAESSGDVGPAIEWTEYLDGTNDDDQVLGVALTEDGDTVWAGRVSGDWQPDAWQGASDLAAGRIAPDGTIVYETQLGSTGMDVALDIAVAPDGSTFLGGFTTGALLGQANPAGNDGFVIRLDETGTVVWARLLGRGTVNQVTATPDGGVIAVGSEQSPSGGVGFAVELTEDGSEAWSSTFGEGGFTSAADAAVVDGDAIVVGFTTVGFDGEVAMDGLEGFVTRIRRTDGARTETSLLLGSGEDALLRVATAGGSVWAAGYTSSTLDPEGAAGDNDVLLVDLGTGTSIGAVRQYGTAGSEAAYGIALVDGSVLLSGRIDDDTWPGQSSAGTGDAFLLSVDSADGSVHWTAQEGTQGLDEHVSVASDGTTIVTGGYRASSDGVGGDLWLTARPLESPRF